MKKSQILFAALMAAVPMLPVAANAQTAGSTVLGVTEIVTQEVAKGWSVKRTVLGKHVKNDESKPESVGEVDDVIVSPDGSVSYLILNASKYLGLSHHRVAIPLGKFKDVNGQFILAGATKEELRKLPVFNYAK